MILFIVFAIIAYLLGSINSAIIVCKLYGLPDPRTQGSGNPGATNVMRVGGSKTPAALTLIGDVLKGFIAVLIARAVGIEGFWLGLVGVLALVGHIFPLFFKFEGGKGVATAFGVLLALAPGLALVVGITWLLVLVFSRYVSLASIVAAFLTPLYTLLFGDFSYFIPAVIISAIIIWRHWKNIQRLRAGSENKVNF
jgi:glycerol-3-phosphate acyltransferase PlsY